MPTLEERALETAVEVAGRRMQDYRVMAEENILRRSIEAHARVIAEFEAFRREVSDEIERCSLGDFAKERLSRFILPKPVDPLVEVIAEANDAGGETVAQWSGDFLAALAKRGGRIVFEEVGDAD